MLWKFIRFSSIKNRTVSLNLYIYIIFGEANGLMFRWSSSEAIRCISDLAVLSFFILVLFSVGRKFYVQSLVKNIWRLKIRGY